MAPKLQQVPINPRWRLQIEGNPEDIAELETCLNGSTRAVTDIVIQRWEGSVPVLTTTAWDAIDDLDEVRARADVTLRTVSGCLNLFNGTAPMTLGTIFEVLSGKSVKQYRFSTVTIRVKPALDERISPDAFRNIIDAAQKSELINSSLLLFSDEIDWFTLYKAIEAIQDYLGGKSAMLRSQVVDGKTLNRARQMANSFRHIDNSKHPPPNPPIPIGEANAAVRQALHAILGARGALQSRKP